MINRLARIVGMLVLFSQPVYANTVQCAVAPRLADLEIIGCNQREGVGIVTYWKGHEAHYASAFDERRLFLGFSGRRESLNSEAGLRVVGGRLALMRTTLAAPLLASQIASRSVRPTRIQSDDWTIFLEDIQYESQQQAVGYPMLCATGVLRNEIKGAYVAVAECFETRFLVTLNALKAALTRGKALILWRE